MAEKRKFGWRDLKDFRVALMLALGFSSGLPFLLVFSTLSVRLREAGVPITEIGLFAWLGFGIAMLCAGAGALYMAEFAGWRVSYFAMAALMVVGVVASILSPIVDRAPQAGALRPRFDFGEAVKAPLVDLYRRMGRALFA